MWAFKFPFQKTNHPSSWIDELPAAFLQLLFLAFHLISSIATYYNLFFISSITTAFYFFNCYCIFIFIFFNYYYCSLFLQLLFAFLFFYVLHSILFGGVGFCIFFNLKNMISTHTKKRKTKDLCKKKNWLYSSDFKKRVFSTRFLLQVPAGSKKRWKEFL